MPDPNSFHAIGWLLVCVFAIAGGVNQILQITGYFRKSPPDHDRYATKEEVNVLKKEWRCALDKQDSDMKEIFRELRNISHQLGQLQGSTPSSPRKS